MLADKLAVTTSRGLEHVVDEIIRVLESAEENTEILRDKRDLSNPLLPVVTKVEPKEAVLDVRTHFTIKGRNLPDSLALWIAECEGITSHAGLPHVHFFSGIPSHTSGPKQLLVKDRPGGTTLYEDALQVRSLPVFIDEEQVLRLPGVGRNITNPKELSLRFVAFEELAAGSVGLSSQGLAWTGCQLDVESARIITDRRYEYSGRTFTEWAAWLDVVVRQVRCRRITQITFERGEVVPTGNPTVDSSAPGYRRVSVDVVYSEKMASSSRHTCRLESFSGQEWFTRTTDERFKSLGFEWLGAPYDWETAEIADLIIEVERRPATAWLEWALVSLRSVCGVGDRIDFRIAAVAISDSGLEHSGPMGRSSECQAHTNWELLVALNPIDDTLREEEKATIAERAEHGDILAMLEYILFVSPARGRLQFLEAAAKFLVSGR